MSLVELWILDEDFDTTVELLTKLSFVYFSTRETVLLRAQTIEKQHEIIIVTIWLWYIYRKKRKEWMKSNLWVMKEVESIN